MAVTYGGASTGPGQSALYQYNSNTGSNTPVASTRPAPRTAVLDAAIGPSSSGGSSGSGGKLNGGWYNGVQYWAPGQGPTSSNNASNGGNSGPNIDDIYNPLISNLNDMSGTLTSNYNTDMGNLGTQKTGQQQQITDQLSGLNNTLAGNQAQFGQQTQSAYTQAIKNYNNLKNQYSALYGGGTSAGPAAMQILSGATEEAMGNLQNTQLNGNQQFTQQGKDIATWGDTQNNQVNTWFNDAQDKLRGTYQTGINAINSDKAMAESEKAQAKLDLLNQVVQHQSALQDYAVQLQNQMAVVQSMNGSTISPYDQSQMSNAMASLGQGVAQATQPMQQFAQLPQQQQSNQYTGYTPGLYNYGQTTNNDPLAQFAAQVSGKTG